MVFFNCDIVGAHIYGDHTIYVGEVTQMSQSDQDAVPLMFYDSHWYHPGHEQ
jgi:flavin reductase (DIM6/NTAB) family NADH-FMN oxidoreductase RutF